MFSSFVVSRSDLSAAVRSPRLNCHFSGIVYGLAQNIDLHDHRARRDYGADSISAAVETAAIIRRGRAVSDLRPDSDGDRRGDLSPMRLGFRFGGQRDSRAY